MRISSRNALGEVGRRSIDRCLGAPHQVRSGDHISMLQDRILTEEGFDAPGNIGPAKGCLRIFDRCTAGPLGLTGVRAKFDGTIQTRVHHRSATRSAFSNRHRRDGVEVRRDINKWAYGFEISDRDKFTIFRTNEEDINFNGGIFGNAFVEYRPDAKAR